MTFLGRVSSPRLASSMLNSQVIVADDEGGSGIFQFTSSGSSVAEDGSPLVQAIIARGGGNFGRVEVLVRSVDGRIGTDTSKNIMCIPFNLQYHNKKLQL